MLAGSLSSLWLSNCERGGERSSLSPSADRGRSPTDFLSRDRDTGFVVKPNEIDGLGQVGRSRVIGRDAAIPDLHRAIPMPERQIVRLRLCNVLVTHAPGSMRLLAPLGRRHIVAVRHHDLPAQPARTG